MRKIGAVFVIGLLAQSCGGAPDLRLSRDHSTRVSLASDQEVNDQSVLANSYLVSFRADHSDRRLSYASYFSEYKAHFSPVADSHLADPRIVDIKHLTAIDLTGLNTGKQDYTNPDLKLFSLEDSLESRTASLAQVDFSDTDSAASLLRQWAAEGLIYYAEPNRISRLSQSSVSGGVYEKLANDYAGLGYWWLDQMRVPQALQVLADAEAADPAVSDNSPIVAVLDSGVDYSHPALKNRIWTNEHPNEVGCNDDIHGCHTTDPVRGRLGDGDVYPFDAPGPGLSCQGRDPNCSHGTHVAGLIAADHEWDGGAIGRPVAGVCPNCRIMILKIVGRIGKKSGILDAAIIRAFKYISLVRSGAKSAVRIANCSFGKFVRSRHVSLIIRQLKDKRSTLLIGAAGNEDSMTMEYPAAFTDAVAVSAVTDRLIKETYSNFGRWVDVAAPGAQLNSTVPGEFTDEKSGTSMAAPLVAGIAGLLVARNPDISFADLRRWLVVSADPSLYESDHASGFNYENYYRKPPSSCCKQPLLGLGVADAANALRQIASKDLPLYSEEERVRPGCSVVAAGRQTGPSGLLLAILMLPVFAIVGTGIRKEFMRRIRP